MAQFFAPSSPMWINRLTRLRSLIADRADDPYTQGRAAQVAGLALLADGLVGLENPLDGKKKRAGILGSVLVVVFGGVFVWFGSFATNSLEPFEGGTTVAGRIVNVQRQTSKDSDGNTSTSCRPVVEYVVADTTYTVEPSFSSSSFCSLQQGSAVDVSYRTENPADGRPLLDAGFVRAFGLIGWVVGGFGVLLFLVRLAEVVAGTWLFFWGRRRVKAYPSSEEGSLLDDLQAAWKGDAAEAGLSTALDLTPAQAPALPLQQGAQGTAGPPPGWYSDPWGGHDQRWWDGTRWTEHQQPTP